MFDRQLTAAEIKTLFDAGGLYRPLRIVPGSYQEVVDTSVVITNPEDVEAFVASDDDGPDDDGPGDD